MRNMRPKRELLPFFIIIAIIIGISLIRLFIGEFYDVV